MSLTALMLLLVGGAARRQNALVLDASGAAARPRANFMVFAGSGTAAALTVACCISIYSVIDGAAVRIAPPIPYTVAVIGAVREISVVFAALVGWRWLGEGLAAGA